MATTQKVTVTLPTATVEAIRELVAAGRADSVSGFVTHAVRVSLDDAAGWAALLAADLEETGGAMTDQERVWADQVLGGPASDGAA